MQWIELTEAIEEPKVWDIQDEPSPQGSDDTARLLAISAFNGFCELIAAFAERGMLTRGELSRLHESMTAPLDNPEMRDDTVVACFRASVTEVLGSAMSMAE